MIGKNILQIGLIVFGFFLGLYPAFLFLKAALFMASLYGFAGNFFGGIFGDSANVFMLELFRSGFALGISLIVVDMFLKLKTLRIVFISILLLVSINVIASYMLILDVGSSEGKIMPLVGAIVGLVICGFLSTMTVASNNYAVNEESKNG